MGNTGERENNQIMKLRLIAILLFVGGISAFGQGNWNWPDNEEMKAQAEEKNVLYNDARKQGNFADAAENLEWLLTNTPDLNSSLYINGIKIYKELAKNASGDEQLTFEAKVMELHDLRIKYFGNEAKVLDRKAYDAYKYYKDDQSKYQELFDLYEKAFELNGKNIGSQNLVAYMDVIRRYKLSGGELSDDDILNRYTNVMEIIDYKIEQGGDPAKFNKTRDFVDKMLTSMIKVDCEFIKDNLGKKLAENPDDLDMAKKIMGLSLSAGCTDADIFLAAAIVVQEKEPNYGIAKVIAAKYAGASNFKEAEKYYHICLELTDVNVKKADIFFELGRQYAQVGRKSDARTNLLKAVAIDPARTKSYKVIGDLYMTSYNECKKGESRVEDRAIFIAAYNMYKKSGDQKSMANAKSQFPSMEDLFNENLSEGDTFKVGCWINQIVTLQRRPES